MAATSTAWFQRGLGDLTMCLAQPRTLQRFARLPSQCARRVRLAPSVPLALQLPRRAPRELMPQPLPRLALRAPRGAGAARGPRSPQPAPPVPPLAAPLQALQPPAQLVPLATLPRRAQWRALFARQAALAPRALPRPRPAWGPPRSQIWAPLPAHPPPHSARPASRAPLLQPTPALPARRAALLGSTLTAVGRARSAPRRQGPTALRFPGTLPARRPPAPWDSFALGAALPPCPAPPLAPAACLAWPRSRPATGAWGRWRAAAQRAVPMGKVRQPASTAPLAWPWTPPR